jgi:hypothetical protein
MLAVCELPSCIVCHTPGVFLTTFIFEYQAAAEELDRFGVQYELSIVSAHRTPQKMYDYAHSAPDRGLKVLIKTDAQRIAWQESCKLSRLASFLYFEIIIL